jgi:LysR family transcriptional regulator, carnitine catabolism transcriptional activator
MTLSTIIVIVSRRCRPYRGGAIEVRPIRPWSSLLSGASRRTADPRDAGIGRLQILERIDLFDQWICWIHLSAMQINVTLHQLESFAAVASALSFSDAATQVHLSQPALSAAIRKLEETLGARLFDRDTRNVALTPAGVELQAVADRLLVEVDDALSGLRAFIDGKRGRLSIAASPSLAADLVPRVVAEFQRLYPLVQLHVTDALADDAIALVRSGKADLALAADTVTGTDLDRTHLFNDRLVLLCAADHVLARRRIVRWRDVLPYPVVAQKGTSSVRQRIEAVYTEFGAVLRPAFEVEYATTLISFIAHGLGIGILPDSLAPAYGNDYIAVRRIVGPEILRSLCIYRRQAFTPSPAASTFVEMCLARASLAAPPALRAPLAARRPSVL